MRRLSLLLLMCLTGCAYMTRDRFDELFDGDGDGWGVGEDCDDEDPAIHPYAADVRGDGCDADCGASVDSDGDDWPDEADCGADDATIYPCSPSETAGDGVDSDCDGLDTVRDSACNEASGFEDIFGLDPDFPPASSATEATPQVALPADCLDD